MRKIFIALTALMAVAVSTVPAFANSTRIAACEAIGGTYVAGNNASNDRCRVVTTTVGSPVATGEPSTTTLANDLGATYLSTLPIEIDQVAGPTTVLSTATTYGDWSITYVQGTPSCVYAGKSKVQKCSVTTTAHETRDVFTITTLTTPLVDVYEVLQDRQTVTSGSQPTTVTTTTRTVVYRFNSSNAIANQQSDETADSSAAGDPISIYEEGDVYVVTVGTQTVATAPDIDVLEPVKTGTETTEPIVVSTITCVINGSKQTIRDNSCPV